MNGSAILNGVRMIAGSAVRPAAVLAAGYFGGGLGAQFGPWLVNTVVNRTATGYISGFLYKQALNATLGQYYYPAGQFAFTSAAATCPSPGSISRAVREHFHHKDYLNELRNSHFDPKQLKMEEVDDDYMHCSYDDSVDESTYSVIEREEVGDDHMQCSYERPVDESTYSIIEQEEANSLPKLPMLPSGKCDQYEMGVYADAKPATGHSGSKESSV